MVWERSFNCSILLSTHAENTWKPELLQKISLFLFTVDFFLLLTQQNFLQSVSLTDENLLSMKTVAKYVFSILGFVTFITYLKNSNYHFFCYKQKWRRAKFMLKCWSSNDWNYSFTINMCLVKQAMHHVIKCDEFEVLQSYRRRWILIDCSEMENSSSYEHPIHHQLTLYQSEFPLALAPMPLKLAYMRAC